ncbi:hypothetical protein Pcinc_031077 [Petrolisthes cinctipes]|uniref:Uncharacterized protein n=1 Tax=Petrolisthes cinctipes TaxID=88211 RepID=A0AAE1EX38_PETCI|nr:hypothetical protein Pcinc_031077 [Petrolisthes cinctipes]
MKGCSPDLRAAALTANVLMEAGDESDGACAVLPQLTPFISRLSPTFSPLTQTPSLPLLLRPFSSPPLLFRPPLLPSYSDPSPPLPSYSDPSPPLPSYSDPLSSPPLLLRPLLFPSYSYPSPPLPSYSDPLSSPPLLLRPLLFPSYSYPFSSPPLLLIPFSSPPQPNSVSSLFTPVFLGPSEGLLGTAKPSNNSTHVGSRNRSSHIKTFQP